MSGDGLLSAVPDWFLRGLPSLRGARAERADTIAYLEQRRDNAAAIVGAASEHDELGDLARDRRRQLEVQIDEIKAGLHHGSAEVRAELLAAAAERQQETTNGAN